MQCNKIHIVHSAAKVCRNNSARCVALSLYRTCSDPRIPPAYWDLWHVSNTRSVQAAAHCCCTRTSFSYSAPHCNIAPYLGEARGLRRLQSLIYAPDTLVWNQSEAQWLLHAFHYLVASTESLAIDVGFWKRRAWYHLHQADVAVPVASTFQREFLSYCSARNGGGLPQGFA